MTTSEDYRHLFTADEFSWKMRMRRGAESFFAPSGNPDIQKERLKWLEESPEIYLANSASGEALVSDCWDLANSWAPTTTDSTCLLALAKFWEADFILLDDETYHLAAGCVCMPSSWDLQESVGKSLTEIHDRVPQLNPQLGNSIERFLRRIPQDQTFFRENWSLTRSAELNYHPSLKRPRLDASVTIDEIYLRIEQQAFIKLHHGVLMGIKIKPVALIDMLAEKDVLSGLRQQLATMPDEIAQYKSLDAGIGKIVEIIDAQLSTR